MTRVLIVDDEAGIRLLCVRSLQSLYDCIPVENAEQAVERFEQTQPDLVVCDIVLPGMNGLTLAHQLRAARPELRVLIVTGKAMGDLVENEPGIGFLAKPFGPEELRAAVSALLTS
jgi:CheY-like chemotaxis protein